MALDAPSGNILRRGHLDQLPQTHPENANFGRTNRDSGIEHDTGNTLNEWRSPAESGGLYAARFRLEIIATFRFTRAQCIT